MLSIHYYFSYEDIFYMKVFNPLFPTPKNVFAPINLLLKVSHDFKMYCTFLICKLRNV